MQVVGKGGIGPLPTFGDFTNGKESETCGSLRKDNDLTHRHEQHKYIDLALPALCNGCTADHCCQFLQKGQIRHT